MKYFLSKEDQKKRGGSKKEIQGQWAGRKGEEVICSCSCWAIMSKDRHKNRDNLM